MNVPLAGEDFDLDKYRDLPPLEMMLAIRRDLEFKMPPVGTTRHSMILAGKEYVRLTWRCDKPNCWYICTPSSDSNLEQLKNHHYNTTSGDACPTPPRRESLPSGLAEIQKLWREIDDVVDAMMLGQPYREMEGDALKAYARGLAFSVVMKDTQLWPNVKAVAAQGVKRWKMRQGKLPWEATPTRHQNDFTSVGKSGGWASASTASTQRTAPARKAAPVKVTPPRVTLSPEKITAIKAALESKMFDESDIALTYGVTIEQVRQITR